MGKKSRFGPGFLVAAAFIGPGTVTSATLAGAKFGYSLLWVVILAVLSAIILQEMSGRFTLSAGIDIGSALVSIPKRKWIRRIFSIIAFTAIVIGCAAYEGGNIVGGGVGLDIISGSGHRIWVVLISLTAFIILITGKYRFIEKFLIVLVVLMGFSFLITGIIVSPSIVGLLKGFKINFPRDSIQLILALLGTTIVPYNIFLHSSVILKKWEKRDMRFMRWDIILAIGLGGIITGAIIVTAAAAYYFRSAAVNTPSDLSIQLTPIFGKAAKWFFGTGLFSAGLSSAITAPYAAAWTARGLFGLKENGPGFRLVYTGVIATGITLSLINIKPLELIILAQVANAVLVPVVSLFILFLLNSKDSKEYRNGIVMNFLFLLVFAIIVLINIRKFF